MPRVQRGGEQYVTGAVRGCQVRVVRYDSCQVRVVKCDKAICTINTQIEHMKVYDLLFETPPGGRT